MEINKAFVVMIYKERSQYRAALEAFDNRENAEKLVEHELMRDGVRAWIEEIPLTKKVTHKELGVNAENEP